MSYFVLLNELFLPVAVPSTVETHTEKPPRSMGVPRSCRVITTQYSIDEFTPSVLLGFLGGSIPIVTPVQLTENK